MGHQQKHILMGKWHSGFYSSKELGHYMRFVWSVHIYQQQKRWPRLSCMAIIAIDSTNE
jgi:hypothetical protein